MTATLTRRDLEDLLAARQEPCVSLYLPTHRHGRGAEHPAASPLPCDRPCPAVRLGHPRLVRVPLSRCPVLVAKPQRLPDAQASVIEHREQQPVPQPVLVVPRNWREVFAAIRAGNWAGARAGIAALPPGPLTARAPP